MLPGESLQVPTLLALIVATFGTLAACTNGRRSAPSTAVTS